MKAEQPTLSGLAAALLTVGIFLGIIGWLIYCVHFAPIDSWQKQIFAGKDGTLTILWLVLLTLPIVVVSVLRLRRATNKSDLPLAVARNIGGYAVAVGMANSALLGVSGPIRGVLTGTWLGGIILVVASEFVLRRRRSNKTLQPTPKDGAAER